MAKDGGGSSTIPASSKWTPPWGDCALGGTRLIGGPVYCTRGGESGSKYWFSMNKERLPRNPLRSLLTEDGRETQDANEILNIAKSHHEKHQAAQPMDDEREEAIRTMLENIPEPIPEPAAIKIGKKVSYGEVRMSFREAPTGKAPGVDGIINEFWKKEIEWYKESQKSGNTRADIVNEMKLVFQDIDDFGPIDGRFAEGRMGLLFKKKDKRNIENYRPVTLLNTDYKMYTSIMARRLREVCPALIHKDQAGFMPKRSIYDHTRLTELIIKFCESGGINGATVALDQEQAYDRIDLEYIWRVMKAFGFPEIFITRVRRLYELAETAVRVNGNISNLFKIRRGVRQGDPMLCLLYNLAIEPLLEMIRRSELRGIRINDKLPRVIVSVYADDTSVYLHESDNIEVLNRCLDTFCTASTARFNRVKTEIIPMGTEEFRTQFCQQRGVRQICATDAATRIARDGESVRILGSWQGNHIEVSQQFTEIMDKQNRISRAWSSSHPSIAGRVRIAKALIVSRALYLMTVNCIPKEILTRMEKTVKNFIWEGQKGTIAWERAIRPRKEGGIGAPCVYKNTTRSHPSNVAEKMALPGGK